jgi:hypothetical protein
MLDQCTCYEGEGGDYAEIGTLRHSALTALLNGDRTLVAALEDQDREGVEWAAEQINLKAPLSDYPLMLEVKRSFLAPNFATITGTPDVTCGPVLFDLKWRRRDYTSQMACYALMLLDSGWGPRIDVYVLYAESQHCDHIWFDRESAEAVVSSVLDKPHLCPVPCDYCGWCKNKTTCSALVARVNAVAAGREDWALEQYHATQIETPAEMGKALKLARAIIHWAEGVEHRAREMALKQGMVAKGFKLSTRQGNRYITSVLDAFPRVGIPQEDFLKVCEVKLSALTEAYAAFTNMKKAPAERELERKLGDVIQRKNSTQSLVEDKEKKS